VREDSRDVEDLAESIKREGLIEPIVLRPKNGKLELVAGSRRLAACRLLGWRKIPSQILELTDQESFEMAIAENVARQSLNPAEEAKAFERYIKINGWGSEVELASKIGKSKWYISRRLRLLALPPEAMKDLLRRHNNPSLLEEILRIDDADTRANLLQMSPELGLSSKDVRRLRHRTTVKSELAELRQPKSSEEIRSRLVSHACQRTVLALRVALHRLDEIIESVKDKDWILTEILMQQRQALHSQIDLVGSLAKRVQDRQEKD
jgi:ParB family transcriptional regulator, chromosome partitioning protein